MQIVTHTHGFAMTDALRHHVRQRLHFAFDRIGDRIRRVVVRLSDINGPRGGADKRCQLEVRLEQLPEVVIEDTQSDLYAAMDRAAERASRTVARRLSRERAHRRDGLTQRETASPEHLTDQGLNGPEETR